MRATRWAAIFLVFGLAAAPASAQPPNGVLAEVTIRNLEPGRGVVHSQICTRAQFMTDECTAGASTDVRSETHVLRLGPVPAGQYAIQAWYDRNGNGDMETNQWGAPIEPTGASRGAVGRMGPPRFDDAAMDFTAPVTRLTIDVY